MCMCEAVGLLVGAAMSACLPAAAASGGGAGTARGDEGDGLNA